MDTLHVTASADALRKRAVALLEAGRIEAARPILAAARALSPESPNSPYSRRESPWVAGRGKRR